MSIYQNKEDEVFNSNGTTVRFYANYLPEDSAVALLPHLASTLKSDCHLKITFGL